MADYVLVHGAFQGGWIWKPVAERLTAAGHTVYRPTLDGCAERQGSLRSEISFESAGVELASMLFFDDLKDAVLVSTSVGGIVVCVAAPRAAERIRSLVFVDALIPTPGETVPVINNRPPYDRSELVYGPQPEAARGHVFADLPPDVQEWALARYRRHPVALVDDPVDVAAFWAGQWSVDVLRCTRSPVPPAAHQRRAADHFGGRYAELDSGHYPMLSHPDELARYLLERA